METQMICVVEDNLPIRKLFCTIMKKSGLNTVDFADADSAYKWLEKNTPDCVVMDILLPDANGTDLLSKILAIPGFNKIPVIAVSGLASDKEKDKYIKMGFAEFIAKPINTATFTSNILKVIDNYSSNH